MFLDIISFIRTFFRNLFSKFSYDMLIVLLFGIVFGFILFSLLYLLLVFSSLKKEERKMKIETDEDFDERIRHLIVSAKNEFLVDKGNKSTAERITDARDISWGLINSIAKEYFPKSKYPVYELNITELIELNHYITNRIDSMFSGRVLTHFKKFKIAQIINIIDTKKKLDETKAAKAASKLKKPSKFIFSVLNVFNPVYWVKKLLISTTIGAIINRMGGIIIEVVGDETNKVYSKAVFNEERELNLEIEKELLELENISMEE